ncbi:MAG: heterodisulfide reductase-related iron-sulfur binding cluster [Betaproteobacteria bacterium]|jgi:Fe-S oxidoreductase|nr:heterodisulfide reductase-related iron-sulfur binding cluster [Betaproteobacteria bacterium]
MASEGNLEAPTRHPVPWKTSEFWDRSQLEAELVRVYDICQGCRRCFSLCEAFPTLFDAVDATVGGTVEALAKPVLWKVVDQCYLCDLCYMTKCPYTPPHPFNLDFPHTMLRAKAIQYRQGRSTWRDRLLASTDRVGKLATIPIVVEMVNAGLRSSTVRQVLHRTLGIHRERELPHYEKLPKQPPRVPEVSQTSKTVPNKVAIFATCYGRFNEPDIARDLARVLLHNGVAVAWVEEEQCCGMPRLELGDLEGVEALKQRNLPRLQQWVSDGYALMAPVPSCVLAFKQELPLLFPDDKGVQQVAAAFYDPFDYLLLRHAEGLLRTDFSVPLGRVSYHVPCHLRVQNRGLRTRDLLRMIPGTTVTTVERCSGHDGTWGVKVEFYESSMKIGKPVFKRMAEGEPQVISSDCPIAVRHIVQGMAQSHNRAHPLTLLRRAYGLEESS